MWKKVSMPLMVSVVIGLLVVLWVKMTLNSFAAQILPASKQASEPEDEPEVEPQPDPEPEPDIDPPAAVPVKSAVMQPPPMQARPPIPWSQGMPPPMSAPSMSSMQVEPDPMEDSFDNAE